MAAAGRSAAPTPTSSACSTSSACGLWKDEAWEGDAWIEGTYIDHLTPFLQEVGKPVVVAMHTVLPEPSDAVRDAVRSIAPTPTT